MENVAHEDRGNWAQIFLLYLIGVFAAMAISQAVPALGGIAREFHPQNSAAIGLVTSIPAFMVALGALLAGWFVDRKGDKQVMLVGCIIFLLGDLAVIYAGSITEILLARILSGIGYVCLAVAAVTMLTRLTSGKTRTSALALWSTFVPMSFIIPFIAAGFVAAYGWRWAFGGHAIILFILTLLAVGFLPASREKDSGMSRTSGLREVVKSPLVYALGLSFAGDAFMQSGITTSIAHYLNVKYEASEVLTQGFNTIAMATNIAGCLFVGVLLNRRVSAVWIAGTGVAISAVTGLAIYVAQPGYASSIALTWIFTFGSGLLVGMWALLPRVAPSPESMGATSGLVTQITLLGVALGAPAAFAAQASPSAVPMAIYVLGSMAVGMAALPVWRRGTPDIELTAH